MLKPVSVFLERMFCLKKPKPTIFKNIFLNFVSKHTFVLNGKFKHSKEIFENFTQVNYRACLLAGGQLLTKQDVELDTYKYAK